MQVKRQFQSLIYYCIDRITIAAISSEQKVSVQVPALKERPEIIVATPTRLVQHLKGGVMSLVDSLQMLVIDEADLVLSYGYEDDVRELCSFLPKLHQSMLMSATLSPQLDSLKRLVLHNPATLKQEEDSSSAAGGLTQCYVNVAPKDKLLMVYALVKLNIVRGKVCLFSAHHLIPIHSTRAHCTRFQCTNMMHTQYTSDHFDLLIHTFFLGCLTTHIIPNPQTHRFRCAL